MTSDPTQEFPPNADLDSVIAAYLKAAQAGAAPTQQELLTRYPAHARELAEFFDDQEGLLRLAATLPPVQRRIPVGTTVRYFGDYELLDEIARGGMGVVYRARQVSLNRVVALKMILDSQLATPLD